jgi:hypothetical protein
MANIKVKDLTAYSDSGSFIRDLSDAELELQGGGVFGFIKKVVKAIGSIFKAIDDVIDVFTGGGGGGGGYSENTHLH